MAPRPGWEDDDLSVRVLTEMRLHLPLQHLDLLVERGDDRDQGTDRGGVGGGHNGGWPSCSRRSAARIAAALAAMSRRRARLSAAADLRGGQPRRRRRIRGAGQQLEGVGGVQVLEGLQRGGEVVAQRVAQPLDVAGCVPRSASCAPGPPP